MKTKREELIDFTSWFDTFRDISANEAKTHEELVDEYLKSINPNAPAESRNVATHEAKKKFCTLPHPCRQKTLVREFCRNKNYCRFQYTK